MSNILQMAQGYAHWVDASRLMDGLFRKYGIELKESSNFKDEPIWVVRNEWVQVELKDGVAYAMPDRSYEQDYDAYTLAFQDAIMQLEGNIKYGHR